jgi:hypothetical protein
MYKILILNIREWKKLFSFLDEIAYYVNELINKYKLEIDNELNIEIKNYNFTYNFNSNNYFQKDNFYLWEFFVELWSYS